jgi:hypothetical protein
MKWFNRVVAVLVLAVIAYGIAFKLGWLPEWPKLFAALVAIMLVCFSVMLVTKILGFISGTERSFANLIGVVGIAGLVVAFGAGMLNWVLSLQGYVILSQGESAVLSAAGDLQAFESGLLSNVDEMRLQVFVTEIELNADIDDHPYPITFLVVSRGHDSEKRLQVSPSESARYGSLVFHQGAFGFSPRIVVIGPDGETILDKKTPFLTRRQHGRGLSFIGEHEANDGLVVAGAVDLSSLDEGLRGHATLRVTVSIEGQTLGAGALQLGHFAEISNGYRVGFAGLEQWSEIDISRRHYGGWVLGGLVIAMACGFGWVIAYWRRW